MVTNDGSVNLGKPERPQRRLEVSALHVVVLLFPPCLFTFRRLMDRFHSRRIVRLTHLIGHVFAVDDAIVAINHKDGSLEQTPFLEPHSVVLPELLTTMGRKRLMKNSLD